MSSISGIGSGALDSLRGVSPWLLAVAVLLHLAKMTAEARAWHGIVSPSHDGPPIPFRTTLSAFVGSIGANAVLPARVGEAFRVGILRRHATASGSAVGGTIILETLLETVFAIAVLGFVLGTGRSVGVLGSPLGAAAGHPALLAGLVALLALTTLLAIGLRARVTPILRGMGRGFAVLRDPRALGRVVGWKVVAWTLRTASVVAFLVAFGLPATLWTAVLVLAAQTVAGMLPLTPGNAGTQQAAVVVALAGTASASSALGFGVGMQAATVVADLALGAFAIGAVAGRHELVNALGTMRRRRAALAEC